MATSTYTPIASITLGSLTAEVQFSSIPSSYRDLVLVVSGVMDDASNRDLNFTLNNDTGANYSIVRAWGDGSSSNSDSFTGATSGGRARSFGNVQSSAIMQVMDYSATDKHKTVLIRSNTTSPAGTTGMSASRYASTSAVTSVEVFIASAQFDFQSGTTLALYGIEA